MVLIWQCDKQKKNYLGFIVISSNTRTIQKFTFFGTAICAVIYISRTFFSNKEVRLSEKATCNIISPHPTILSGNTISETAHKGQD